MTSREILTARETCSRPRGGISPSGKHGNTSMLQLHTTKMIESLLVTIGNVAQWIPASEFGGGGTDFIIEGTVECGGGSGSLAVGGGGGKGASAGEEGGEECELHHG